ncbi:MAG: KUP/HAK/KT family potassium transporter, partial [Chitinophagaceae bacterium]|nr:KUP/HAK/KT family potassium transporter [Chitinophagaceae bacterium]
MNSNHGNLNRVTIATLLVALGIIYGDIGTSPLYVLKAIIGDRPVSETLVYGGVSLIFYTLLFQTTLKYIWLTLQADNQGEGGVFSLYALVRRYSKHLVIPTILGATTLLADGIITPPISVASAVEGLNTVHGLENIIVPGNALTIGIVIMILSALFFFQRFGTNAIGKTFGPVMLVWFSMLFVIGCSGIIHHPYVLKAFNPYYGYQLLIHYPRGFWLLGAVFLCTTGAEALYSDLGHCGIRNIRITWAFVKISLLVNYAGQAAWVMHSGIQHLDNINPFFEMMPDWFLIPGILIATAATIIASQALISGSYTLISEAMNLNFWPRVTVRQPSDVKGQIYIPSVNIILWFGCILMVLYFRNSSHMEAAYGFSITVAMMMTTVLLNYFLIFKLKWKQVYVTLVIGMFAIIETSFFIANVAKIRERWMFLFFELFIFMTMYIWYYARRINNRLVRFVDLGRYSPQLVELSNDDTIPKFSTHLIYLTKANSRSQIEEKIIRSILSKKPKRADVYWFLHVNRTTEPYTLEYDVSELVDDKIIKINLHIGFRIQPRTEIYFKRIVQELVQARELNLHIRPDGSTRYNSEPDFTFVVIEKFLSVENEFTLREGMLLSSYFMLKNMSLSDEKAFGLDKNDVVVEYVPLVYQPSAPIHLRRVLMMAAFVLCGSFLKAQKVDTAAADFSWVQGNNRQSGSVLSSKYFTGSVTIDAHYNYSFNHPIDHTTTGSTSTFRANEFEISYIEAGGDFHNGNSRARLMFQFGTRATGVPRNDVTALRGQYDLYNAMRYITEAYAGRHLNILQGMNIDIGLFKSYIGLLSYNNFENWNYQPSFTSDNTPWFFTGLRMQLFPSKKWQDRLKLEAWLINGWQTYGMFNEAPGIGLQVQFRPKESLSLLCSIYGGYDTPEKPSRFRFHSDNSVVLRYRNTPVASVTKAAFSLTADLGFENGAGVSPFGSVNAPAQNFVSLMAYHRLWFARDK